MIGKNIAFKAGLVTGILADVADLERDFGFKPATPLSEGLAKFAAWYKEYYKK